MASVEQRAVVSPDWAGSAWQMEATLHQLSPYIGKTKSSMAASLVRQFTAKGDVVYDPFSGCGTFAFEAWVAGRKVIANDLSPYANLLTKAKLFPYECVEDCISDFERLSPEVERSVDDFDLRTVPLWVREFFHPDTLREVMAWSHLLKQRRRPFLLACLLGILHHQRPGFLSFPSSHTVPYLRTRKFPEELFPDMYEYRPVRGRLEAKVRRAFRRIPKLDFRATRICYRQRAERLTPSVPVDAILSSPPYMRQLDYARDNRLRLWFLGCADWERLDNSVSPSEDDFLRLMLKCFQRWEGVLKAGGNCILVVGNACSRSDNHRLPAHVIEIAESTGSYQVITQHTDTIPDDRRVRRGLEGSTSETIVVFRRIAKKPSTTRT